MKRRWWTGKLLLRQTRVPALSVLVMLAVLPPSTAWGQLDGPHFELWGAAGQSWFPGSLAVQNRAAYSVRLGYYPQARWGVEGGMDHVTSYDPDHTADRRLLFHLAAGPVFHLMPAQRVSPHVAATVGWVVLAQDEPQADETRMAAAFSVGVKAHVANNVALRLEARDVMTRLRDELHHLGSVQLGVAVSLGRSSDRDGDGVSDGLDDCPETPTGAFVDARGCPLDTDGDGVSDGLDDCPETPRGIRVDRRGCARDSDMDGVADDLDLCPRTPQRATVTPSGCPVDSDADGVPDGLDACAGTPAGALVDAQGCSADVDGDGVADGVDECPGTPAGDLVDNVGCTRLMGIVELQLVQDGFTRLDLVGFVDGMTEFTQESREALDELADILRYNPTLRVEVACHTEATDDPEEMLALSRARAESVVNDLVARGGIALGRLVPQGYGGAQPLTTNETDLGRQRNRRVEIRVLEP